MQSKPLGGFYTGYDYGFGPVNSSTNTETTCLCLMPYTVPQPPSFGGPVLMVLIIGAAATTGVMALYILTRRQAKPSSLLPA